MVYFDPTSRKRDERKKSKFGSAMDLKPRRSVITDHSVTVEVGVGDWVE